VEVVRRSWEHFRVTGGPAEELLAPGFVWDMSTFRGWPEQQRYEGAEGVRAFLREWVGAFEDWSVEPESVHDAGEEVVWVCRQRGRSKLSGAEVDMVFAQVWSVRDGMLTRMQMYADPAEGLAALGFEP
jgi:ketosteroid isomerase-like protein